jgi:hypothetical protein
MKRGLAVGLLAFVALIGFPREGQASFWDYIWEMSGPAMFQLVSLEYRTPLMRRPAACADRSQPCLIGSDRKRLFSGVYLVDFPITPKDTSRSMLLQITSSGAPRLWLSTDVTAYTSATKDSGDNEYDFFKNWMVAVEPLVKYRLGDAGKWREYYVGAGASYQYLFGENFEPFDKFGLKFRAGVLVKRHLDIGFNFRVYPNGFTPDEFGHGERIEDMNRDVERTYGFSFGWLF